MRRRGLSHLNKDASSRPLSFVINRFLAPRLVEAWIKIRYENQVADRCVASIARRHRLGSRDRRRLAEAVFTALRRRGSVDALMADHADDPRHSEEWLATALEQDWPDGPSKRPFSEAETASQAGNLPPLVCDRLRATSLDLVELGRALRRRAPVTLRCAPGHREQLGYQLGQHGVSTRSTVYAPDGLVCQDGAQLHHLNPALRRHFEIQDEGSQLLALLVGAKTEERILDACAGAGGKTLALIASGARITASDIDDSRLGRLKKRLGNDARHVTIKNVSRESSPSNHNSFDRILIDAPCSGTGTGRRAPDLLWRLTEQQLEGYVTTQQNLLNRYADWVRPGGYLIYGTCSILPDENEDQITQFLSRRRDFERRPIAETLGDDLARQLGCTEYLQLFPHLHNTDGFFGSLLRRST